MLTEEFSLYFAVTECVKALFKTQYSPVISKAEVAAMEIKRWEVMKISQDYFL